MPKAEKIYFHYLVSAFYFPNRNKLKRFILLLFKSEGYEVHTINYIFCSDEYLLRINRRYLKHNMYTDIVTFPLSKKEAPIVADIYISIERIRENAADFSTTFYKELYRVIFHGALHLCGYKDTTVEEKGEIKNREDYYLNHYLVSRETTNRKL